MSRWFRLYADAMRNPKVARLSDSDFRLWVRLLAIASENDGKLPPLCDLKVLLSVRLDHLSTALKRLLSGGLIDPLEDGYEPHHWGKFQYKSDVSTERVHKHRAKRNVSETPPETDTEAETESTGAKAPSPRARRLADDWRPETLGRETIAGGIAGVRGQEWMRRCFEQFQNHFLNATGKGSAKPSWQRAWANWVIEQDRRDGRNGQRNGYSNGSSIPGLGRSGAAALSVFGPDERDPLGPEAETLRRIGPSRSGGVFGPG